MKDIIKSNHFEARWGDDLANHMPMAVLSLLGLGFEMQELENFADFYQKRLDPMPPSKGRIHERNWRQHLGDYDYLSDYFGYFRSRIGRYGHQVVLEKHLPLLVDGVISDGFHPLIRLAFGLDFQLPSEQAMALAYWAAVYRRRSLPPVRSLNDWQASLEQLSELECEPIRKGLIAERLDQALIRSEFRQHIHGGALVLVGLDSLREVALRLHWARNNIVSLHAITAVHAARVVIENVPMLGALLLPHLAHGLSAMVLAEGAPFLHDLPQDATIADWTALREQLRGSRNDHAIKLVYSCQEEAIHYGDARYQAIANRQLARRDAA